MMPYGNKNLYNRLIFLIKFTKLAALTPINSDFDVSRIGLIYSFLCLFLYQYKVLFNVITLVQALRKDVLRLTLIIIVKLWNAFVFLACILGFLNSRHYFTKLLQQVSSVDLQMRSFNMGIAGTLLCGKNNGFLVLLTSVLSISYFLGVTHGYSNLDHRLEFDKWDELISLFPYLFLFMYSVISSQLVEYIELLIALLRQRTVELDVIRHSAFTLWKLCECAQLVNAIFSLPLSLVIINSMLYFTYYSFFAFNCALTTRHFNHHLAYLFVKLLILIFIQFEVFKYGDRIKSKGSEFHGDLLRAILQDESGLLANDATLKYYFKIKQEPKLCIFNAVHLEYSYLLKIVASQVVYSLIFIQFELPCDCE